MNRPVVSPMDLFRVSEFDPDYRQSFEDADIMQFEVWTADEERIGKVSDILMDDIGQLYYLVASVGSWLNRKTVLIKPEQFRIDRESHRINLVNIEKGQVNQLPLYNSALPKREATQAEPSIYPVVQTISPVEASATLESSAPLGATPLVRTNTYQVNSPAQRATNDEPALNLSDRVPKSGLPTPPIATHTQPVTQLPTPASNSTSPPAIASPALQQEQTIQLLEERLVVNRLKRKVGEVVVRKEIETRIVEIPIRREKLIIEQVNPDHKHLATVDLPSHLSDAELTNFAQTTLDSIESNKFISAEIAQRVLSNLSQRNGNFASGVKLVFEDANLQAEYEQQLAQILAS
jgi:stress response protein YsnF